MEKQQKEVLVVSAYVGGYPGPERSTEYLLFARLYQEGYTYVVEGDEACLWVANSPLPKLPATTSFEEDVQFFQSQGFRVLDLEEDRPDLLPVKSNVQQGYSRP